MNSMLTRDKNHWKNFLNFKNLKSERYISEPRFAGVKFSLIRRRILYVTACSLGVEGVSLFTTHAGLVGVFANKQHLDRRTLRRPRRRVIMMYRVVLGERPVAVITAAAAACDNTTNWQRCRFRGMMLVQRRPRHNLAAEKLGKVTYGENVTCRKLRSKNGIMKKASPKIRRRGDGQRWDVSPSQLGRTDPGGDMLPVQKIF